MKNDIIKGRNVLLKFHIGVSETSGISRFDILVPEQIT